MSSAGFVYDFIDCAPLLHSGFLRAPIVRCVCGQYLDRHVRFLASERDSEYSDDLSGNLLDVLRRALMYQDGCSSMYYPGSSCIGSG